MPHTTFWSVFADTVVRFGDRTAVEIQRADRVDRFTYRQLHDMAEARGLWLVAQGVQPGDRCAILAQNDGHWCAAYLGILSIGATAVPLDTNYSATQVATIVRDCGARIVFASEAFTDVAHEALRAVPETLLADIHVLLPPLRGSTAAREYPSTSAPEHRSTPAAAVILYTSGTTSDPKGVVLSHANLLAERDAAFKVVAVTEQDAILGVLPLFHSLAQLANLLLPFAAGARVVYLETVNSTDLLRALGKRNITIFACVPQLIYLIHQCVMQQIWTSGPLTKVLFKALLAANFRLRRLGLNIGPFFLAGHDTMGRSIRLLVTGGSKFDPAVGRDLYALGFDVLQAYGLTETSAAASISRADEAHLDTVGRPLPGVEVRILPPESSGEDPVSGLARSGEIAIRGPIVMQGYFNRPDATAEVMKDGWFLTGDLGRIDSSGRITITGRKKEMIVLASGKNIYPEEVEKHYQQSPFVKEMCVMGLPAADHPTSARLHAVVVPDLDLLREKKIVNAGDILRFEIEGLAVGLPPHQRVPSYDVWFEPLPRTTTQQIKRHEVERRVSERAHASAQGAAAPLSDVDRLWMDDAHVSAAAALIQARVRAGVSVRPDANLELDLGLDSMERVELLTELEQCFHVKVPQAAAHEIFTVRQLVDAVRPGTGAVDTPTGVSLPAGDGTDQSWAVLLHDLPLDTDPVLGGLLRPKPIATPVLFLLSRLVRMLLGRVRVTGLDELPATGPFIICANHQSYLDPLFICGVLPFHIYRRLFFLGAVEYFETPLTRWVARTINLVPVDPDSNLVPAMKAGGFGLAHGKVLVLFPEGERSIDGTVKKFKKGSPILARHLGVPIVPVVIKGVYELWPRNRAFNWRLVWPWSGHRITITIGEPMTFAEGEDAGAAAIRLRERVNEMWESS